MSNTKFTPGPWIVCAAGNKIDKCIVAVNAGGHENHPIIFRTVSDSFAELCEPSEANANLISAAPDMYDFINECKIVLNQDGHINASDFLVKAKNILNKANPQK